MFYLHLCSFFFIHIHREDARLHWRHIRQEKALRDYRT